LETEDVHEQIKTSQNILKICIYRPRCIENANINIQWKFHESSVIRYSSFELHQKQKLIFLKTSRYSIIFLLFFPVLFKTIENFVFLTHTKFQLDSLSYQKIYCWRKSISIFTVLKADDTKKKINKHIIVKSLYSESKICRVIKLKLLADLWN